MKLMPKDDDCFGTGSIRAAGRVIPNPAARVLRHPDRAWLPELEPLVAGWSGRGPPAD